MISFAAAFPSLAFLMSITVSNYPVTSDKFKIAKAGSVDGYSTDWQIQ